MKKKLNRLLLIAMISVILMSGSFSFVYFVYGETKTLDVVIDDNYPPYIFYNNQGHPQGILVDHWKLFEEKTGINVQLHPMDWGDAQTAMKAGEYDIIDTMFYSKERDKIYDFTEQYENIETAIFFHNSIGGITDIKSLKGFIVGAKKGDYTIEKLLEAGVESVKTYSSYEDMIKAASRDEIKIFIMDIPPALYYLNKYRIDNDYNYTDPVYTEGFCRAVMSGDGETLALINKGFDNISEAQLKAISRRWLGNQIMAFNYLPQFILGLGILILILMVILVWTYTLRRKVKAKTSDLAIALDTITSEEESLKTQINLFESLLKVLPIGVFMVDAEFGKPLIANEAAKFLLGRDIPAETTKDNLTEVYDVYNNVTHEHYPMAEMPIIRGMHGENSHVDDMIVKRPDGTERLLEVFGSPIIDSNGKTWASLVAFSDITESKAWQEKLLVTEEHYKMITNASIDGYFVVHTDGRILDCNDALVKMGGYTRKQLVNMKIFDFIPAESMMDTKAVMKQVMDQGYGRFNNKFTRVDGHILDIQLNIVWSVKEEHFLGFASDVTEQNKKKEELLYISYHDQLTGVYNRRYYEEELSRLETTNNLPLTIVMCDVNGLKLINDSFGHAAGDELLKKSAQAISYCCRTKDLVARHGGDEFAIILPNTSSKKADDIIKCIKSVIEKETVQSIDISISFGYETKTSSKENLKDIIRGAEDNMYRQKLYESSSARSKTVDLIINTLYEKNHREMLHSKRVSDICVQIAEAANMSQDDVNQIRLAGLMHDIGKIGVDETILNKVEKLSDREWEAIKKHSEIGYRILSSVNEFSEIAGFVLEHQEKWDGTGYPKGLKGEEISVEARIIAIADAYDAMTGKRTYRESMSKEDAIIEMKNCAGSQFDMTLTKIFIEKVLV